MPWRAGGGSLDLGAALGGVVGMLVSSGGAGPAGGVETCDALVVGSGFGGSVAALRLAVLLCHARQAPAYEAVKATTDAEPQHGFTVTVPPGWAKAWPQSAHLLREEVLAWQRTPWGLKVHGLDD